MLVVILVATIVLYFVVAVVVAAALGEYYRAREGRGDLNLIEEALAGLFWPATVARLILYWFFVAFQASVARIGGQIDKKRRKEDEALGSPEIKKKVFR